MSARRSFAAYVCGIEGHEEFTPKCVVLSKKAAEDWVASRQADIKRSTTGLQYEWPAFYSAPLLVPSAARVVLDALRESKR